MDQILISATALTGGIGSYLTLQDARIVWQNYSRAQGWDITVNPREIVENIPRHSQAFLNLAHSGLAQITLHNLIAQRHPHIPIITVLSDITEWSEDHTEQNLKIYRNQKRAIKQYLETHHRSIDRTVSLGYVSTDKILAKYKDNLPKDMITPTEAAAQIIAQIYSAVNQNR